jgi:hypothetical protein
MKKLIVIGIIILSLCFSCYNALGNIVVEDVTVDPETPTKLSTVTITAIISGLEENDEVFLWAEECDGKNGVCDPETFNVSMTKTGGNDEHVATINLKFPSGTYFHYRFNIYSNGSWTEIKDDELYRVEYHVNSGDNGGNTDNGGNDDGTPGFELLTLLAAIFIGFTLLRKRDRR